MKYLLKSFHLITYMLYIKTEKTLKTNIEFLFIIKKYFKLDD